MCVSYYMSEADQDLPRQINFSIVYASGRDNNFSSMQSHMQIVLIYKDLQRM